MPQDSTLTSLLDEIRRVEQRERNALQSDLPQEALERYNKDLMIVLKQAEQRGESLRESESKIRLEGRVKELEAREIAREKAVAEHVTLHTANRVELDDNTRAVMQALVLATYQPEALLGRLQYAESSVVLLQRQLNDARQR
ncbi:hypothetical protein BJ742DRAFT_771517 [Cladochytrium replicatum]|nr:hypothetical protein BJ742DRAFT_771517 [Cladochytrium replicatum]